MNSDAVHPFRVAAEERRELASSDRHSQLINETAPRNTNPTRQINASTGSIPSWEATLKSCHPTKPIQTTAAKALMTPRLKQSLETIARHGGWSEAMIVFMEYS
ncbi:hypothetical protein [Cupriavidus sp. 8B]